MKLQLVILMSGPDDLFKEAGYIYPKNLIEIDGVPLVQRVLDSLAGLRSKSRIVVCTIRRDEERKNHTGAVVRLVEPKTEVISVQGTAGAACSALLAIERLSSDDPLVIVNGDQILDVDLPEVIDNF